MADNLTRLFRSYRQPIRVTPSLIETCVREIRKLSEPEKERLFNAFKRGELHPIFGIVELAEPDPFNAHVRTSPDVEPAETDPMNERARTTPAK